MQLDDAGRELAVLGGGGRRAFVFSAARERVVEGPMLHVALPALHDHAAHAGVPARAVGARVGFGKMEVRIGHPTLFVEPVEEQRAVAALEGKRVRDGHLRAVEQPLVHAPEMAGAHVEPEFIDEPRDERELLGRADGAADAGGIVVGALPPRVHVFERLGEVEIGERVVHHHAESGARKAGEIARGEARGFVDEVGWETGVVPPIGGDGAGFVGHGESAQCAVVSLLRAAVLDRLLRTENCALRTEN